MLSRLPLIKVKAFGYLKKGKTRKDEVIGNKFLDYLVLANLFFT